MKNAKSSNSVVVVGAGNAGLCAAIAARQSGSDVFLLEASSRELRGGNSRFSGGLFRFAHAGKGDFTGILHASVRHQVDKVDCEVYAESDYVNDVMRTSDDRSSARLIDILVSESLETMQWMASVGVPWEISLSKFVKNPESLSAENPLRIPGGGVIRAVGEGVGLVESLFASVEALGIEVHYETPVVDFVNEEGRVTGVIGLQNGAKRIFSGNVILASGGFESSAEMRTRYLGPSWDVVKVRGTAYNTGLMLQRAIDSGASAVGNWSGCHAAPIALDAPDVGDITRTDRTARYSYTYGILVNREGSRFVDEGEDQYYKTYAKTGGRILAQPGGIAYQVFDQKTIQFLQPRYETSQPVVADSIEELGKALGMDPARLSKTVSAFNRATPVGTFDAFSLDGLSATPEGQPAKSNWAMPLDVGPFVAYAVTCGITFTYGGLGIDDDGRVLGAFHQPLDGLFATGEITGGFFYTNYPAGAGLMRGSVFGRRAGRLAAGAGKG